MQPLGEPAVGRSFHVAFRRRRNPELHHSIARRGSRAAAAWRNRN